MIGVSVEGVEAVVARFDSLGERVRSALRAAAADLGEVLRNRVRSGPLAGGVLQRRSGRLADSVIATVSDDAGAVTLRLGAEAPYARFQELGFQGSESVRASVRTIRQAFGRAIPPRAVMVRAHTRRVDYPAHPFLRPVLDASRDEITARFADAVRQEAGP